MHYARYSEGGQRFKKKRVEKEEAYTQRKYCVRYYMQHSKLQGVYGPRSPRSKMESCALFT